MTDMADDPDLPRHILIPVALDHDGAAARKLAFARRMLAPGGRITLLTVLEQIPAFAAEFVTVKTENHLSQKVLAKLEAVAQGAADVDCRIASGKPGMQIVQVARDIGADLILVAAHHPAAVEYFLGSTAARVARRAPCSVHILR
ncbi:universal stress protein [Meridianimarinicoccus sp. RP-17]|uniref:universal stress protein n=1 Tax=Meridianimarinicoccus zhengii TaxID=2056810 RepID=UPI001C9B7525|nr:universal stress protein [Phycocomes zhengii]